jgi:hypothetical protein
MDEPLPPDPWRPGDLDVLYEGLGIAAALDALEDDPRSLTRALATLSGDDARCALFALTFERWIERAVQERRGRLRRVGSWLRAKLEHAGSWPTRPPHR